MGKKFKLHSDHYKKPRGILARWILNIQDLDYEFEYIKGKQNTPCDYLSRFPDDTPLEGETEEINALKTKYAPKNKKLRLRTNNQIKEEYKDSPLSLNSIKECQRKDKICAALIDQFLFDEELPNAMKTFKNKLLTSSIRSFVPTTTLIAIVLS